MDIVYEAVQLLESDRLEELHDLIQQFDEIHIDMFFKLSGVEVNK